MCPNYKVVLFMQIHICLKIITVQVALMLTILEQNRNGLFQPSAIRHNEKNILLGNIFMRSHV